MTVHSRHWVNITENLRIRFCELAYEPLRHFLNFVSCKFVTTSRHNLRQGKLRVDLLKFVFWQSFIRCLCPKFFLASYNKHLTPPSRLYFVSKVDFFTSSFITGWGLILYLLAGLCHSCKLEVHAVAYAISDSFSKSLISWQYKLNLQSFIITASTWLWTPTDPATHVHEAYLTAPITNLLNKVQLVICGLAHFLKLW